MNLNITVSVDESIVKQLKYLKITTGKSITFMVAKAIKDYLDKQAKESDNG